MKGGLTMSKVRRTVRQGRLRIYGRTYRLPDYAIAKLPNDNIMVWANDAGVIENDKPEWGLITTASVPIYWPTSHDWFTHAKLNE